MSEQVVYRDALRRLLVVAKDYISASPRKKTMAGIALRKSIAETSQILDGERVKDENGSQSALAAADEAAMEAVQ